MFSTGRWRHNCRVVHLRRGCDIQHRLGLVLAAALYLLGVILATNGALH